MRRNSPDQPAPVLILMGVSGSGKTTVGKALADRLHCPFHDGDDFHPPKNVAKMAAGHALSDEDRAPWLARIAETIARYTTSGEGAVFACSALKKRYRDTLRVSDNVRFIFLNGDFDLILSRMQERRDHYMRPEMLRSQFEDLERPGEHEAFTVSVNPPPEDILAQILQALNI